MTPMVEVFFDLSPGSEFFTIEDPVFGELDGAYGLAGGDGVPGDIASHAHSLSIRRGRTFELDDFPAGTCVVELRNYDARFLPAGLDTDFLEAFGADAVRPGRRVRVSLEGVTIFDGTVEDWDFRYEADGRVSASFVAEDVLAALARTTFTDWTTTGQLAGVRVSAVLDRSEVSFGAQRDIDDGVSTLQSDNVSWGSNVKNYLDLVARSDLGRLFASRSGVLTFRDRRTLAGATPAVTIGSGRLLDSLTTEDGVLLTTEDGEVLSFTSDDEIVGLPIRAIDVQYGSEVLYTRVQVDREGGIAQTRSDATAIGSYGTRTLPIGELLLDSDDESDDMAAFLLSAYSAPRFRFRSVSVILDGLDQVDRAALLSLDLGSVVSVIWTPVGVESAAQQTLVVEGVGITSDVDGLSVMSLELSPLLQESVFVVGDSILGALDNGAPLAF